MYLHKPSNRLFPFELKVLKISSAQMMPSDFFVREKLKLMQWVELPTLGSTRILNTHRCKRLAYLRIPRSSQNLLVLIICCGFVLKRNYRSIVTWHLTNAQMPFGTSFEGTGLCHF